MMDSSDLCEWRRLLGMAERPSVKLQIENIIKSLESAAMKSTEESKPLTHIYTQVTSFSWDQTNSYVNLIIPMKETVAEVIVDAQDQSLDIKIKTDKRHYQLRIRKLYSAISPDGITYKTKADYINIKIPKANEGRWSNLSEITDTVKKAPPKPSESDDPQHMIMDLMKNLYKEGDDDMKRTIAKAWTEAMDKKKI